MKIDLQNITSPTASSNVTVQNNNNTAIEDAIENTLSRDGTSPNSMEANLDMNSHRIYNLPEPLTETEPVRLAELNEASGGAGLDGDKGDITVSGTGTVWSIDSNSVTFPKLIDLTTQRVIGRNTAGTGDPEEVSVSQLLDWLSSTQGSIIYRSSGAWTVLTPGTSGYYLQTTGAASNPQWAAVPSLSDGDKGDITVSASGATWTIDASTITYAKMQNVSATDKILGRSTAGAGVVEEITCTATGRSIIDDASTSAVRTTLGLVINTDVQGYSTTTASLAGLSLVSGDVLYATGANTLARLAKGSDGQVLKLASGLPSWAADLTGGGGVSDADYGDIVVSGSASIWTIDANAVSDTKLRDSSALSVIGRSANSTGDPADIAAGSDGHVLRRSGTTLGFGTVATAGITDDAVTYAKLQNVSATDKLLGRVSASAGDVEEVTFTDFAQSLVDDVDAATARATLGLVIGTNVQSYDADNTIACIPFVIDGGGSAITTGIKGDLEVPFNCTINSVTLLADQTGSIVIDIWKDTYANYPPVDADSITASAVPTISANLKAQDNTLTGWTTSITAGQTLRFNVDSASTITRVTVSLKVTKS